VLAWTRVLKLFLKKKAGGKVEGASSWKKCEGEDTSSGGERGPFNRGSFSAWGRSLLEKRKDS